MIDPFDIILRIALVFGAAYLGWQIAEIAFNLPDFVQTPALEF